MASFRTWLEAQVEFINVDSYGGIAFIVDGVRHRFERVDTSHFYNGYFAKWIKRGNREYNPETAFKFVKGLVEKGQAIQVEPKQPNV